MECEECGKSARRSLKEYEGRLLCRDCLLEQYEKDMLESQGISDEDTTASVPKPYENPFEEITNTIHKDFPERFVSPEPPNPYTQYNESADDTVEVKRSYTPRKVKPIRKLTKEEVEKRQAEIELRIARRSPMEHKKKKIKDITEEIILNAGSKGYYEIFGVDETITCDELKERHRELTKNFNVSTGIAQKTEEEVERGTDVQSRINLSYDQLKRIHCG